MLNKNTVFTLVLFFSGIWQGFAQTSSLLDISNNDAFSTFSMLDTAVMNKRVVFTGENHLHRKSNYQLEMKMFRYLHKTAGFRNFFMEFGHARAWLVNQYVQTGDTALYNVLNEYSYEEYAQLYKELREMNEKLPDSAKIHIYGIDIERNFSTPVKVLSLLLPKEEAPHEIRMSVESIKAMAVMIDKQQKNNYNRRSKSDDSDDLSGLFSEVNYSVANSLYIIFDDLDSNRAVWKRYLGNNYDDFALIEKGLRAEFERSNYINQNVVQQYVYREMYMHDEMMTLLRNHPNEKFYGQFGRCHTSQEQEDNWCGYYYFKTLATRIGDEADLKNQVLSIGIYYPQGNFREQNVVVDDEVELLVPKADKNGLTLFSIANDSSVERSVYARFPFVIINQMNVEEDNLRFTGKSGSGSGSKINYYYTRTYFEFNYSYLNNSFSSLNNSLSTSMGTDIKFISPLTWMGGSISVGDDFIFASFRFDGLSRQSVQPTDSLSLSLSGFSFRWRTGGDLILNQVVDWVIFGGSGFSQLNLIEKQTHGPLNNGGIFGNSTETISQWRNPAFFFEAGMDLRVNLKFFFIGCNASYMLDLSNKKWRINGSPDNNSPYTKLSGLYFGASAGFYVKG